MIENIAEFEKMIKLMDTLLDERAKRILLGCASKVYGRGGISKICDITGMAPFTIRRGIMDADSEESILTPRIRKEGAGRPAVTEIYPELLDDLKKIVEGNTYGDPEQVLFWTTLSLQDIQGILAADYGINISHTKIGQLLEQMDYSRQRNQKNLQVGAPNPNRNEQFGFINRKAQEFLNEGEPVISVDTKKKENIGNFKNDGTEYRRTKDPRKVLDHDFPIAELGKVAPYGVYVLNDNTGFVNLGTDHDTAEFACESILRWWETTGRNTFPDARKIYINCDGGGSNGSRTRLWKYGLQQLADHTGLEIHVSHLPPGTSKWNKIEHRMFCYISKNWQGQPLIDIETVVKLISNTTTKSGLRVSCQIDTNKYEIKKKVSDEEMEQLNLFTCDKFGYWNYIIKPKNVN